MSLHTAQTSVSWTAHLAQQALYQLADGHSARHGMGIHNNIRRDTFLREGLQCNPTTTNGAQTHTLRTRIPYLPACKSFQLFPFAHGDY